jgi:tetratricopeptide (TPR) repeat protein
MLGWIAYLEGNYDQSLSYHEKAEELEPGEAKIKFQKGLTLIRLNRGNEAITRFQKSLEIEPLHIEALPALVQGLVQFGRAVEAIPFAERAARASNLQNARVIGMLAEVYRAANDHDKAAKAYQLAIELAKLQDPALLPQLEKSFKSLSSLPNAQP